MEVIGNIEEYRFLKQKELDGLKTKKERNVLGQFSTPKILADDILKASAELLNRRSGIRFLDPAFGVGCFFSALLDNIDLDTVDYSKAFEIDPHYGIPAQEIWADFKLDLSISDFSSIAIPPKESDKFDLVVCNPPYSRHHHLGDQKNNLQLRTIQSTGIKLSGLSGLYCYFLLMSHQWMAQDAIGAWLIPSEFMDVNYGREIKKYLLTQVTLLSIHRFDPSNVQFEDALVSSCVVLLKNAKPTEGHQIKFSFGGSVVTPNIQKLVSRETLRNEKKWTRFPLQESRSDSPTNRISDYFKIKRGIASGDNKFFILSEDQIKENDLPIDKFRPILPSPRYLKYKEILSDSKGVPILERALYLLDCDLHIDTIEAEYPSLYKYLQSGVDSGVSERYICRHRKAWYLQENREPSPFYCTYIGRSTDKRDNPFQFILNRSKAIVTNSYLMVIPKPRLANAIAADPKLLERVHSVLNSITTEKMLGEGRVYGGGMFKLEPKELANVPVPEIQKLIESCNISPEEKTAHNNRYKTESRKAAHGAQLRLIP